jgi:hypothetical protein
MRCGEVEYFNGTQNKPRFMDWIIGRVTILVYDPAAGVMNHVLSWRCHRSFVHFRLESATSRTFRVMQCLPIVAVGSILRWNQFSDRQQWGRQSDYGNGNETTKFAKNHQILSRIKGQMGNFDGFLMTADYNEYTGQISAFCMLRLRRNVSKTTGHWATGDGLVKTRDHIHIWSK